MVKLYCMTSFDIVAANKIQEAFSENRTTKLVYCIDHACFDADYSLVIVRIEI